MRRSGARGLQAKGTASTKVTREKKLTVFKKYKVYCGLSIKTKREVLRQDQQIF